MIRVVHGELRKIVNPIIVIAVLAVFAYIWIDMRTTNQYATVQAPIAISQSAQYEHDLQQCRLQSHPTPDCQDTMLVENQRSFHYFATNGRRIGEISNALRTWPGALRFTTRELVSGLGWLLLVVIFAVQVAAEWGTGGARYSVLATGSLWRFLLAKVAAIWLALIGGVLALSTALYAVHTTVGPATKVPAPAYQSGDESRWHYATLPADPNWASLSRSFGWLAVAGAVWLVLIVLGVAVAALARRGWIMLLTGVAALAAMFLLDSWGGPRWSIFRVITNLFRLPEDPYGVRDTRVWRVPGVATFIQQPPGHVSGVVVPALAWAGGALILGAVCFAVLRVHRVRA